MKRMIVVMLSMLVMSPVTAKADVFYDEQTREWGIPRDIHTQADLERYEGYRKGFVALSIGAALGAVICAKNASGLKHKADHIDIRGPLTAYPQPGGGVLSTYAIEQGMVEAQDRFRSKSDMYKKGAIVGALAAVMALSISFSLRF